MDHLCYLCFVVVSRSTSELRMRLACRETDLGPPVKYFTDRSKASFVDLLCYFCLVFVMLSCASVY